MKIENLKVYLSGEIHSNWRKYILKKVKEENLSIKFLVPITNHTDSDDCGVQILGKEEKKFWHDYKGASINSIRIKNMIEKSDIVIVKFGEKYKQWNAAFDAGFASASNKSLIVIHKEENQHALKEIDAAALAVTSDVSEVVKILDYVINGKIND